MSSSRTVVILGSTSAIARAVAIAFGRQGFNVILGARDVAENAILADDVRVRSGMETHAVQFDAEDFDSHPAVFRHCVELAGDSLEGVVACFGFMDEQAKTQANFAVAKRTIDVNFTAMVSILEEFAAHFEAHRRGFIAAISSVAGDKGRQSNYIYGASKGGLNTYLQGLRNRMYHAGVPVTTIKPGFVDTKMTFALPNLFLVASPEKAGNAIVCAIRKQKDVAYVPWFWQCIMMIFQHLPERIFKRLKT